MTFLEDLIDYFVTQSVGAKGTTLFLDFLPDNHGSPAAVLINSPAPATPIQGWINVGVQVLTRGDTYEASTVFAGRIHNLLQGAAQVLLPSGKARILWGSGPLPQSIGNDEAQKRELSANYELVVRQEAGTIATSTGYGQNKSPDLFYL